jgi:hypothetical protein
MNNIDLESLPYPMFKTTQEEKDCLRFVLPYLTDDDYGFFLCNILEHYAPSTKIVNGLVGKIGVVLAGYRMLCAYLRVYLEPEQDAELRRIWVRKLLTYTGE